MNVLIVEDESFAAERLTDQLLKYDSSINVLKIIDTVEEASSFMKKNESSIDLAFLDIQLADGKSFEIFSSIEYFKPIIFTTAYDQFTLDAFKLNSIDYLLKPIKYKELKAAIEKMDKINGSSTATISKEAIDKLLSNQKTYKKRFIVKFGSNIRFKESDDIAYLRADDRLCHLIERKTGKQFLIDHTLEELDSNLLNPNKFFRINRKFIVNIDAVENIKTLHNKSLKLKLSIPTTDELTVSRNRVKDFKNWIDA